MSKKGEPWYIHGALYLIIAILIYVLIRVAIIDPTDHIQSENYFRAESQLRMDNIRQAQIQWKKKHESYTDNLQDLVSFVKSDSAVNALIIGVDSLTNRSTNPFKNLTVGSFIPDSLLLAPKSQTQFLVKIDTTTTIDTIINKYGKLTKVDTNTVIGSIYYVECPDGYGTIGDLESPSLKNTASWE